MNNIVMNVDFVALGIFLFAFSYCFDLIRRQYNAYRSTKQKFKLFVIRDELAQLVLTGELEEDSREFIVLRDAINYSISQVDDLSIRRVVSIAINWIDKEDIIQFKSDSTIEIAHKYFTVTREMVMRNSRLEIAVLSLIFKLFNLKSVSKNTPVHAVEEIDEKQEILQTALTV